MTKVLFLIMYSGEGDYELCKESVYAQEGILPTIYEVKHHPMQEAHKMIYSYWNKHKDEYDMFVKLDADCVLANNTKAIDVYNAMQLRTNLAGLGIWTQDFVRNRLIPALIFGNRHCTFNIENVTSKAAFDTSVYQIEPGYVFDDTSIANALAPAAFHGYHSTPMQTFAQGVKRRIRRGGQWDIYEIVRSEFINNPEILRFMFLIGWNLGEHVLADDYNYTDAKFIKYFNRVNELVNNLDHKFEISNIINNL
jgi:hypothetical protein